MSTIIQFERVRHVYQPGLFRRPVTALESLDLSVDRGEVYGFLGANGAGKTTTFKLLLGLLRPTSGRGAIFGLPLGAREARRRLGFVPELPSYYPHLTPLELLRLARSLSGVATDDRADTALLAGLGLETQLGRPLRRLSKGQVQRLGLAQALVHEPELLILDEPMSGLDPIGRALVKDRIRKEKEKGTTILLASHVLADVEVIADRVGFLSRGRIAVEGKPAELLARSILEVVIEGEGHLPLDFAQQLPAALAVRTRWERREGCFAVRLERPGSAEVDLCLRRLIAVGVRVRSVETRREDLETLFLDRLGSDRADDAGDAPQPGEEKRRA